MKTVNIHHAKTHLSGLLARVALGESFVIAKAGKPVAKVVPIQAARKPKAQRMGGLEGRFLVPDDFNTMGQKEIEEMFYGRA
ncbi:MAG: type II toxin-antitoxin system Phd/YefM family antitoxin [Sphingosinicella sp.]